MWLCRKESELLRAVEDRLVVHPLTCPILGNDQKEFRGRVPQVCLLYLKLVSELLLTQSGIFRSLTHIPNFCTKRL